MLSAALAAARAGEGSLVVVEGPLGCGKSALLDALRRRARELPLPVASAHCARAEQHFDFGTMRQLMGGWQPAGPLDAAGPATWLADPGVGAPMVVTVDDLHWSDESSLAALGRLATRIWRLPLLVAVAVREGDPGSESAALLAVTRLADARVRPGPCGAATARALVGGGDVPAADCLAVSGGNPLLLTAAAAAVSRGLGVTLPEEVKERITAALRVQPEPVRAFATALALMNGEAPLALVGCFAELDPTATAAAYRILDRLGLVAPGGEPAFAHTAARSAALELMTPAERVDAQARAVRVLHENGGPPAAVADRLLAIPAAQGQWAIDVLRTSAEAAVRRGEPARAAEHLRRALLETSAGADRAMLCLDLAAIERSLRPSAAHRHFATAVAEMPAAHDRAVAIARLPLVRLAELPASTAELVREAAGEPAGPVGCDRRPADLALRLEARLRGLGFRDPAELTDSVVRLGGLGPRPPQDTAAERDLLAVLLHAATTVAGVPARVVADLAHQLLQREPALPEHVHGPVPLLVPVLCAADSPGELPDWLETVRRRSDPAGAPVDHCLIRAEQALVYLCTGRLGEARAAALDVVRTTPEPELLGLPEIVAVAAVTLEAEDRELTRWLVAGEFTWVRCECTAALLAMGRGAAAVAAGDLRPALAHLAEGGAQLDRAGWRNVALFPWRSGAARLYARLGYQHLARDFAEEELVLARRWGAPAGIGRSLRVLALSVAGSGRVELLREAVDTLAGSANRRELARAQLSLGRVLAERGDAGAAEQLRLARKLAVECRDDRLAWQAAEAAAAGQGPRAQLTRSERRVVDLAVAGRSNPEIARTLEIGTRTVEKHLTNAYRKLGVSGRVQLAEILTVGAGRSGEERPT